MSEFNIIEQAERLLRLIDKQANELSTLRKDVEILTKENSLLKEALAYEQRQHIKHAHKRG